MSAQQAAQLAARLAYDVFQLQGQSPLPVDLAATLLEELRDLNGRLWPRLHEDTMNSRFQFPNACSVTADAVSVKMTDDAAVGNMCYNRFEILKYKIVLFNS